MLHPQKVLANLSSRQRNSLKALHNSFESNPRGQIRISAAQEAAVIEAVKQFIAESKRTGEPLPDEVSTLAREWNISTN